MPIKKFIDLSKEESLNAVPQIQKNAERLSEISRLAAEKEDYGIATSLCILSSEETVKSFIVFLHGNGIDIYLVKKIKDKFSRHPTKHDISIGIDIIKFITTISSNEKNFFKSLLKLTLSYKQLKDSLTWWQGADKLKNRGLYVDYIGKLSLPQEISKEEYNTALNFNLKLKENIEVIKSFFENTEKKGLLVNDINKGLKEIYNNPDFENLDF